MAIDNIINDIDANEIHVLIEIPMNDKPIKYEYDKNTGTLYVDRFMQTTMSYPCNYGFIPNTLSGDGDAVDVLVVCPYPVVPGCIIKSRPIGVLMMEDESGIDEKIIAVPAIKIDPSFSHINDIDDLDLFLKKRIIHFFEHYKDLDKNKWVKVQDFANASFAKKIIIKAHDNYVRNNSQAKSHN